MAKNDDHYAIVVGIDTYPQLPPLQAAVKDAVRFAEWLTSENGGNLPDKNLQLVVSPERQDPDPIDARPIQKEIDRALRDFGVERDQRIGQRLYFYFSGHGFGLNFNDVGMLMANASLRRLNSNIGLINYLTYFHNTALWDEVVLILDCCRDRALSVSTAHPSFSLLDGQVPLTRIRDFVVLGAAWGEKAFERRVNDTGERRGVLTEALLEALQGNERAVDAQGQITAATVRDYLQKRVKELAKELKADKQLGQEPEIPRVPASDLVFRKLPILTKRVQIVAPKGLKGDLVLRDGGDLRELGRRLAASSTAQQPWEVQLPRNSRYEVEHTDTQLSVIFDLSKAKDDPYVFKFPRPE